MEWDEYGNIIPFGQQRSQPQEWDEFGRPVQSRAPQPQQQAPQGPPPGYSEAAGGVANFGAGFFGLHDEATGVIGGGIEALRGGDFLEGYEREANRTRSYRDQFLQDRPLAGNALQGVGAAAPVAAALAAGQPQLAAGALNPGRAVAPGLFGRMGQGAAAGAGYGYAYGFGSADNQPLGERMLAGNDAAVVGGVVGGALPPAFSAGRFISERLGRPAWELATGAARRLPVADPNAVGMSGGNIRRSRATPNQRPERMDPVVGRALERLQMRTRQPTERIEGRLRGYRLNPNGEVLVDVFEQPGIQMLRSQTQSPGQAGQRALETYTRRANEQPQRVLTELNRRMAVAETPQQAMASLDNDYRRMSAELFEPLFAQQITPQARTRLMQRFAGYQNNPVMQDAAARAQRIFELDRANGVVQGSMGENMPRFLHYMKMGLDDAAFAARMPDSGIGRTELRGIQEMRVRFVGMLDDAIPGYRNARQQWGGRIEAEEALEEGAQLLNRNSAAVRQYMAGLSPFAQYHARVGFANELANRIGLRGGTVSNRNVTQFLDPPEMQARVRAMFDDPEEAAAFLDTVNQQNRLMMNARQWGGGSPTHSNDAHAADNAAGVAAEAGIDMAIGQRGRAIGRLRNFASMGAVERANDRTSEVLLRRVDNDADFARLVVEELRRREAARLAQAQAGRYGGAAAGTQQGDN